MLLQINLNQPMKSILSTLSEHPIRTRVSLTGTLVVARDIAHAKLQERLDNGEGMPQYMLDHPVYYAGPAKTPEVSQCVCVWGGGGGVYGCVVVGVAGCVWCLCLCPV